MRSSSFVTAIYLCLLSALVEARYGSEGGGSSSISRNTCRRFKNYVARNCKCRLYRKFKCKKPHCGSYDYGRGCRNGGCSRNDDDHHKSYGDDYNGGGSHYGSGEGKSYGSKNYNGEGGSSSRYGGRDLAATTAGEEGEVLDTSDKNHRDLCRFNWDRKCECCCSK